VRPTLAGLQHYVRELPLAEAPRPELARAVDRSLEAEGRSPELPVRAAVQVLAEVAGCVAISFVGDARAAVVEALEIVPLVGPRALVVVGFHRGSTSVHPIHLDRLVESTSDLGSALLRLQACLRGLCIGRTLEQAHAELARRQSDAEWRVDRLLAEALRIGLALCSLGAFDPLWLHVAGHSSLARELALQLAATASGSAELVSDVLVQLDDYRRLADVLCQLLPAAGEVPEVLFGGAGLLGNAGAEAPDAHEGDAVPLRLAVVGCRWPGDLDASTATDPPFVRQGAVALVGALRMDYAEVVPLVQYAAKALAARTCA
jgi:transcriptional regulator of heat shock response